MKDNAVIIFKDDVHNISEDLEVPLNISANELFAGLNQAYKLGVAEDDFLRYTLRCENPIALLKGERTLAEYGIRDGSRVMFVKNH